MKGSKERYLLGQNTACCVSCFVLMNSFLFSFLTFYAFRSFVFTGSKLSKSHFQSKSEKDIVPLRKESDREGIMYLNTCTLKAKVITCIDVLFFFFLL